MFLGCQNSLPWGRVVFVSTWRRHDAQSLAGQVCHTTKSRILNDLNTRRRQMGSAKEVKMHLQAEQQGAIPICQLLNSPQQLYPKCFLINPCCFSPSCHAIVVIRLVSSPSFFSRAFLLFNILIVSLLSLQPLFHFSPGLSECPDRRCSNYRSGRMKRPAPTTKSPEPGVT